MFTELEIVRTLMQDFSSLWAVGGGWAIDLFVNRVTRQHKDIDLIVFRHDQLAIQQYLKVRGWTLEYVFKPGELTLWEDGHFLELPTHTIWCNHPEHGFMEVLLNELEGEGFAYRRDQSIQLPLSRALIQTESGFRVLAPEIVLLYKSNNLTHEGNRSDFVNALPFLDQDRRQWLRDALQRGYNEHEWLNDLYA